MIEYVLDFLEHIELVELEQYVADHGALKAGFFLTGLPVAILKTGLEEIKLLIIEEAVDEA